MAGLTLAEAQALRAAYLAAMQAIATGKSYTIGTRILTRADEAFIARKLAEYSQTVDALTAGSSAGIPLKRIIPRDL